MSRAEVYGLRWLGGGSVSCPVTYWAFGVKRCRGLCLVSSQSLQLLLFRGPCCVAPWTSCHLYFSRSVGLTSVRHDSLWHFACLQWVCWFDFNCLVPERLYRNSLTEKYKDIFWIGVHSCYFIDCQNHFIREVEPILCYLVFCNLLFSVFRHFTLNRLLASLLKTNRNSHSPLLTDDKGLTGLQVLRGS